MNQFDEDIEKSLAILRSGGTILYPTDTVWGLGCDATDEDAVNKIYALKQRPKNKGFILLLADERDLLKYVTALDLAVFDYLHSVTKPTTVIYEGVIGLAPSVIGADGTAAFRLVKEPFCKTLIKRLRKPLVSTSANLSADHTPRFYHEISEPVRAGADYVVHYRREDTTPREPSAVIRWKGEGNITVIRE